MKSQLCLGTAQFGGKYGVTNKDGKPDDKEIELILKNALSNNIKFFDTANAYGDAETILGEKLKNGNINLITKFNSGVKDSFSDYEIHKLENNLKKTLKNLRRNDIDSYLLHDASALKKKNSYLLFNWLEEMRSHGKIKRIGISIYEESDLDDIPLQNIQVVQMPISIYDQRLLKNSFINRLLENNISIHIRSIFLQGLLLQKSINWPKHINKKFLKHHYNYENEISANNLSLMDAAISFIKQLDFPELILFGVTSSLELKSINKSWNSEKVLNNQLNFKTFRWDNINDIDPRKWIYN
tara:strand:- start:335 stop:1228 length:894 start_codon:yes stop_codon:yes gene_type:complete